MFTSRCFDAKRPRAAEVERGQNNIKEKHCCGERCLADIVARLRWRTGSYGERQGDGDWTRMLVPPRRAE